MSGFETMGKLMIVLGAALLLLGGLLWLLSKVPFLGHLPGDIRIERDGVRFYFPITTCLLISLLITVILLLLRKKS